MKIPAHKPSHSLKSRMQQGWTKIHTLGLVTAAAVTAAIAIPKDMKQEIREAIDPTVPTELASPRNLAATPGLQDAKDVSNTTEYDNGYGKMTRTNLTNAARVVAGKGRSPDAQAFNSLWEYLTTCGMIVNSQNTLSGTNMIGGVFNQKDIIDKTGTTVNSAPHQYNLEVYTDPKNKKSRIIKFSWDTPYDQNVVNAQGGRTDIVFNGYYEFHQLGENGSIQMYEVDKTNGKRI